MSWSAKRSLILLGLGAAVAAISAIVWPGDLKNQPMTAGHWVAVGGLLLAAVLLVIGAGLVFVSVVGGAWNVDDFDPNEYLDDTRKGSS